MKTCETYEEAVRALYEIPKFTTKNPPESTRRFYEFLGCPSEEKHILHIAGTNGKGSVCAYLESILSKAGYRTALFSSPHLVDIRERMRIGKEMISEEDFCTAYRYLAEKVAEYRKTAAYEPTYFEALFFMGMLWFERQNAEFIVLETGLGGRLDATNVIRKPELCIITSIGLDHMEYLGDTLEAIAGEKAGIIKPGVPVIVKTAEESVNRVFTERAELLNSPVYFVSAKETKDVSFHENDIDFSFAYRYYEYAGLTIRTAAEYQLENAALAIAAVSLLREKFGIGEEMIREGLRDMVWEARMEKIRENLYLDGAHNIPGIRALLKTVSRLKGMRSGALVFAAVKDKAYGEMVREITESRLFDEVLITEVAGARSLGAELMQREFVNNGFTAVSVLKDTGEAFDWAVHQAESGRLTVICGSLYLAGQVKCLGSTVNHD